MATLAKRAGAVINKRCAYGGINNAPNQSTAAHNAIIVARQQRIDIRVTSIA